MLQRLLQNWKTTSAGLTLLVGAGVHLAFQVKAGTADESTWKNDILGIIAGIGLIAAGDAAQSATKKDISEVKEQVQSNTDQIEKNK